jgi:phosphoribosyl-ATP pyrophosphohydrolase
MALLSSDKPENDDTKLTAVTVPKSFDSLFAELTAKVAGRDPHSSTVVQTKDQAATEISQLLYHIQVLMLALDLDLGDIYNHL